jgi:peroxiredoxin
MHAYRDQYAQLFRDGQDIVLIAISTDSADVLQSWAEDDQFQFLFASDVDAAVGKQYGAFIDRGERGVLDNRSLFIVDKEGKIAHVMAPFREVDPTSYEELREALDRIAPKEEE